ncbi:MAG TPA: LysR substrate-binding domain-containing protein, partial [Ruania sp.]|nr:LysR substrate-binding domain-containing protein [Ruania sp.]
METRRLQYFVAIVDAESITRAAEILLVAQPALSQHMTALEAEFREKLLVRSRKGVYPTPAGQSVYRYARAILRLEEAARNDIASSADNPAGQVSIGLAPYSQFSYTILPILRMIRQRYPGILIRTMETLNVVHSHAIRIGQIDAGLIYQPGHIEGILFETISTEELYLVAAPGTTGSSGFGDEVQLSSVADLWFIMPRDEHTLRRRMDAAMFGIGRELNVAVELEHTQPLARAVMLGLGVTVLPLTAAQTLFSDTDATVSRIIEPA